jgi:hypothetical protein
MAARTAVWSPARRRGRRRGARESLRRRWKVVAAALGLEAAAMWLRGYAVPGRVVVRCRDGHLFTTIWIPGASLKALRFVLWRFQYCPVGHHWTVVTLVRRSDLSEEERVRAAQVRDLAIP